MRWMRTVVIDGSVYRKEVDPKEYKLEAVKMQLSKWREKLRRACQYRPAIEKYRQKVAFYEWVESELIKVTIP